MTDDDLRDALQLTEQQLRTLTELVPALLWAVDAEGRKVWLNARWLQYTGQTHEQTQDGGWLAAIHPDDATGSAAAMAAAYASGQSVELEHRVRRWDGEYRWFLMRQMPVTDARGKLVQWLGTATDIDTQRKAMSDLADRVDERTGHLRRLLLHLETVQDEERKRFARELHDTVGQHLALALLLLSPEQQPDSEEAARQQLDRLRSLLEALDRDLHRVMFLLRPAGLGDGGLAESLASYLVTWGELTGLPVDFACRDVEDLPIGEATELAMFRLVQESLNNVVKHAAATKVSIALAYQRGELVGSVEDDGQGFDVDAVMRQDSARRHWGLLGMQERVQALGGYFAIESTARRGTAVLWRLPPSA